MASWTPGHDHGTAGLMRDRQLSQHETLTDEYYLKKYQQEQRRYALYTYLVVSTILLIPLMIMVVQYLIWLNW